MSSSQLSLIVLAAGKGTRMKSAKAKVLHELYFSPMIHHVLQATIPLQAEQTLVIVGHQKEQVTEAIQSFETIPIVQKEQLGTGHAVRIAENGVAGEIETVMVLCGDTPLIQPETLQEMVQTHKNSGANLTVLTTLLENPTNYGRIVLDEDEKFIGIVEEKDASKEQKTIKEINGGIYCVNKKFLFEALHQVGNDNSQGEIYLTDIVHIAVNGGLQVERFIAPHALEVLGVNSRIELAQAHQELKMRQNVTLMALGVSMHNPESISISPETVIGQDTVIMQGVQITGKSTIGRNCILHPGAILHNCQIGDNCSIGAYSVLDGCVASANSILQPHAVSS